MRRRGKVLSLVMAMLLTLSMSMTAFAAETTKVETPKEEGAFSITITNEKGGHIYHAYQVFKGDLLEEKDADGKVISTVLYNIEWGSGVDDTKAINEKTLIQALKADSNLDDAMADVSTAADVAKALEGKGDDSAFMQAFADVIGKYLSSTVAGSSTEGNSTTDSEGNTVYPYTITLLKAGYYFVKDTQNYSQAHDAYTKYILQVVSNVTVNAKSDVPELTKKIVEGSERVDANNTGLGKVVSYEIKGSVPDYTGYEKYFYVVNDTLSSGLTFNSDIKVTIGGTELKAEGTVPEYYVYTGDNASGHTFRVAIADIKEYDIGSEVVVTYSATVNKDALIGDAGNPNTVNLIFSNDPNSAQSGTSIPGIPDGGVPTGKTPDDMTLTYVAEIDIAKTREDGTALAGAEFTLTGTSKQTVLEGRIYYELSSSGTYYLLKDGTYTTTAPQAEVKDANGNVTKESNESLYTSTTAKYAVKTATTTEEIETQVEMTAVSDAEGKIEFKGLGVGTYTIEETKVPAGYNKADNVTVVIECVEPTEVKDGTEEAKWSKGSNCSSAVTLVQAGDDGRETSGIYAVTIINKAGAVLPSTGGIGTTIFYVLGSVLAIGAVILLVVRRRMRNLEDE